MVARRKPAFLQQARFQFGTQHCFTVPERNLHVSKRERPVFCGNEIFAFYSGDCVKHGLIEHIPGANLILDHIATGLLKIHSGQPLSGLK
jgi:hypothetical protein